MAGKNKTIPSASTKASIHRPAWSPRMCKYGSIFGAATLANNIGGSTKHKKELNPLITKKAKEFCVAAVSKVIVASFCIQCNTLGIRKKVISCNVLHIPMKTAS